ncbi:protein takeout-like [Cloeon dipterum]|uniref:protein takeout-like n=1 Tax=Cloeon dipterum TaxID=197152 RepID=UPI0032201A72
MTLSKSLVALVAVALAALPTYYAKSLPSYFKVCERDADNFGECIVESVNALRPHLDKGIRSFKIPPLNPLSLEEVSIDEGTGPVAINLKLTKLRVKGGQDYKVNWVRPELENHKIHFSIDLPVLEMHGDYEMDGRALVLPIKGKGVADIIVYKISPNATLIGKPVMRDGVKYMEVEDFPVNIGPASLVKLNFDNLFGGNKQLGDNMNRFLNSNWKEVMDELRPIIENVVSAFLISASQSIFNTVPFDTLFPLKSA